MRKRIKYLFLCDYKDELYIRYGLLRSDIIRDVTFFYSFV